MKITVRFTGPNFPESMRDKVRTGEVAGIMIINEASGNKELWNFNMLDCPGYEATIIQEEKLGKGDEKEADNDPVAKDDSPYLAKADDPSGYSEYPPAPVSSNVESVYSMIGGNPKKVSVEW
jgi:hypothetical protein